MSHKFLVTLVDLHPRYNPADQHLVDELRATAERVNTTSKALRVHIGDLQSDPFTPVGFVYHYDGNETLVHREDWTTLMKTLKAWFP